MEQKLKDIKPVSETHTKRQRIFIQDIENSDGEEERERGSGDKSNVMFVCVIVICERCEALILQSLFRKNHFCFLKILPKNCGTESTAYKYEAESHLSGRNWSPLESSRRVLWKIVPKRYSSWYWKSFPVLFTLHQLAHKLDS